MPSVYNWNLVLLFNVYIHYEQLIFKFSHLLSDNTDYTHIYVYICRCVKKYIYVYKYVWVYKYIYQFIKHPKSLNYFMYMASHVVLVVKNTPANAGEVRDLGLSVIPRLGRSPGEGNGNPSQYCCWRTPWTEEPGGLQCVGLQRVGHNWSDLAHFGYNIEWVK